MGNYIGSTIQSTIGSVIDHIGPNYVPFGLGENWLRNRATWKFGNELIEKGHTCVVIAETNPIQVFWCGSEVCTGL
jgi:hypothetical protein